MFLILPNFENFRSSSFSSVRRDIPKTPMTLLGFPDWYLGFLSREKDLLVRCRSLELDRDRDRDRDLERERRFLGVARWDLEDERDLDRDLDLDLDRE